MRGERHAEFDVKELALLRLGAGSDVVRLYL
jgi:hypothetical protein